MLYLALSGENRCAILGLGGALKIQNHEGCLKTPWVRPFSLSSLIGATSEDLLGC